MTLEQAVRLALAQNPSVRAADAAAREAAERVAQARAGFLPRVSVLESWQRGNQPVFVFSSLLAGRHFGPEHFRIGTLNRPDAIDHFRAMVVTEQPVIDGGRARAAVKAAGLGRSLAALDAGRLAADLTLQTTRAYGQVPQAQAASRAADAAVLAAEEDVRRAARRRDAGFDTDASVLALDEHLAQMRERQIRAHQDEAIARAELNRLMGLDLDRVYALADVPLPVLPSLDLHALEAEALASRPEMTQARLRQELALAQRAAATADLLPQVSLQVGVELNGGAFGDRTSAWLAGVGVSWTVFSAGASQARRRETVFAVERARSEREEVEAAVRVEARSALARLEAARAREASGRAAVEQAHESQRIVRERYDAGLAPAGDLLRANLAVLDAASLRVDAIVAMVVAAAELDRAVGRSVPGAASTDRRAATAPDARATPR